MADDGEGNVAGQLSIRLPRNPRETFADGGRGVAARSNLQVRRVTGKSRPELWAYRVTHCDVDELGPPRGDPTSLRSIMPMSEILPLLMADEDCHPT